MSPPLWQRDPARLPGPLRKIGEKEVHLWIGGWLKDRARKLALRRPAGRARHLLFALCDHYEPLHGRASREVGLERVRAWREGYPRLASRFRDSTGRPPRHSFFFPGEEYDPRFLEPLAELAGLGLGEVEVHLHHDGDTRETLRHKLEATLRDLSAHGVLAARGGKHAWAFIHGNWSLANGRRDGRWCGVDDELVLLHELGCYADFTFPSAPDQCQPAIVNAIYYPRGDVARKRAYEDGDPVRVGTGKQAKLLMIEGPLALARRGRRGVRIESGALDAGDPPTAARLETWVAQGVSVVGRPEWVFVKVHTHGAPEPNARMLLGEGGARLHEALARYARGREWLLHYVTAREMYNVARAAMDGRAGSPEAFYDYEVPPAERGRRR
jgi:hypothetical protein